MAQRLERLMPFAAACLPVLLVALPHDWRWAPLQAAVLALVAALAWSAPLVDRDLEYRPGLRWLLMAGAAMAVAWLLFGASLRATWGIIDDHEIHAMIGPGRDRITVGELPARMATHPEIASPPFTSTRYRPAYYFLRLCEATAWGRWAEGWMLTRLVLFAFTATLGFDLLRQWLGFVGGGIALAMFAMLWMWPEIVVQLGPPECYAAPAVVAFAWCAAFILRSSAPPTATPWAGLAFAALMAIGSKENFVVLAPLTLALAAYEWRRGRLTQAGVVACTVVGLAAAWVTFVVGAGIVSNGGRDVYQRPVGLSGFTRSGEGSSGRAWRKLAGYGGPLILATLGLAAAAWRARHQQPRWAATLAIGVALALVAISQFFFYRGEVFKKCRYDLPFVPLVTILLIGALVAVSRWRQGSCATRRLRRRLLVPGTLAVLACLLGGDRARGVTEAYVNRTREFQEELGALVDACRAEPGRPVVFTIGHTPAANYEPVLSIATYLRSFGVENPLFLDPASVPLPADAALASWQERDLAAAAAEGGHRFTAWRLRPPERAALEVCVAPDPSPNTATFQVR